MIRKTDVLVYVNAGNDKNGNPRRGWIHYVIHSDQDPASPTTWTSFFRFYDEGYEGTGAIPKGLRRTWAWGGLTSNCIHITPGQYRSFLRQDKLEMEEAKKRSPSHSAESILS